MSGHVIDKSGKLKSIELKDSLKAPQRVWINPVRVYYKHFFGLCVCVHLAVAGCVEFLAAGVLGSLLGGMCLCRAPRPRGQTGKS